MCVHSPRQTAINLFSVLSFACFNSIKQCLYSSTSSCFFSMCVHSPRQTAINLFSVLSFACCNSTKQCLYSSTSSCFFSMCVHSPRQTAINLFSVLSFACCNSIKQCLYSSTSSCFFCIKFIDISYNFIAACTYSFKIYRPFITAYLTQSMQPVLISFKPSFRVV